MKSLSKAYNKGYNATEINDELKQIMSNFKMPQVWKTSLAVDYNLPISFPMTVTLEGIYTNNINGVMLKNYNLKQADATWERFSGNDDRYIYPDDSEIEYTSKNAYVLANSSEGWGATGNISIFAEPVKNLNLITILIVKL